LRSLLSSFYFPNVLYLIQILCFWTLSIVLFLFKTRRIGDWILSPFSGKTYFVELVRLSSHRHQHKVGYIDQAQHKPSARVKTKD
jgi:hypothetical protein